MDLTLNQIICGDCLEVMKDWPDNCVDTIITDPPYGLSFMGKKWDYDVPCVKTWLECLRVLKPGGTLLCFAGSRTQHRMAVNVEDAGFILKDCIMWLYGSGFPKAMDISKQLQKKSGKEPVVVGQAKHGACNIANGNTFSDDNYEWKRHFDITAPTDAAAVLWNGWKSHGLKPAYEPILVAMKPNEGSYANNALKHGVSGLNIDGARIPTCGEQVIRKGKLCDIRGGNWVGSNSKRRDDLGIQIKKTPPQGRFPANVLLDEVAAKMLDEQSGIRKSGGGGKIKGGAKRRVNTYGQYAARSGIRQADSGYASRFFYCAKACPAERNARCEELPVKQKVFNGQSEKSSKELKDVEDRFTTKPSSNHHPTVKPLKLIEYLCTLTKTPTGGVVLDCFGGSGTTALACINTGREYILIEKDPEYCEIANKRISCGQLFGS